MFFKIIFFGSLWGITEATLGHLLHITPLLNSFKWLPASILFPIGIFFMEKGYNKTQKISSVFFIALTASLIKMIDVFITPNILIVINPTIAILSEGAVFFLFKIYTKELRTSFSFFLVLTLLWESLYIISNATLPINGIANSGLLNIILFLSITPFSAGFLSYFLIINRKCKDSFNPNPVVAFSALSVAIMLQIILLQ